MIKCLAFDCFGTVFGMAGVPRQEIEDYVAHVRSNNFSPFQFPAHWHTLPAHPDVWNGLRILGMKGYRFWTASNGSVGLLRDSSCHNGIFWDGYVDFVKAKIYKPHLDAYAAICMQTGCLPSQIMMVTANPTFGDVEGAERIGMTPMVIRPPGHPATIVELAEMLPELAAA